MPFHQQKNGCAGLGLAGDEVLGGGHRFVVDRLHPLLGQRAEVLDGLAALAVGLALQHAARAELLQEGLAVGQFHVPRVVALFRLFFGVEVIEAAEEFVEAVHRRQMFVAVALVVLAELARGVALALEDRGHRHVGLLPAFLRAGHADLGHAAANRNAAADERGPACRAALLCVVVGEGDAFPRDAVDVRRLVAHHAAVVVADVPGADVVAPDAEDVRLLAVGLSLCGHCQIVSGKGRFGVCRRRPAARRPVPLFRSAARSASARTVSAATGDCHGNFPRAPGKTNAAPMANAAIVLYFFMESPSRMRPNDRTSSTKEWPCLTTLHRVAFEPIVRGHSSYVQTRWQLHNVDSASWADSQIVGICSYELFAWASSKTGGEKTFCGSGPAGPIHPLPGSKAPEC